MNKIKEYTINQILSKIRNHTFMLPAWQREYVWDLKKIVKLFDSIFKNYPINNILIWETKTKKGDIFYSFINECSFIGKKPNSINEFDNISYTHNICGILDGQQRLTSLWLVLDRDGVIERKQKISLQQRLCVKMDENEIKFAFKNKDDVEKDLLKGWFDIKELYNNKKKYYLAMLDRIKEHDNSKVKVINRNYIKVIKPILEKYTINLLPVRVDYRTALEIFDRINTNAISLTPSEITYSLLIFGDNKKRKELNNKIKLLNSKKYKFRIDFFIKLIMLIHFGNSKYEFNDLEKNRDEINKKWSIVFKYTNKVIGLLKENCIYNDSIASYNALLPIVYYYYRCGGETIRKCVDKNKYVHVRIKKHKISNPEKDALIYYLRLSLINGLYGSSTDDILNKMKYEFDCLIDDNTRISKKWIKEKLSKRIVPGGKNYFSITKNDVKDWIENNRKGTKTTKLILRMLYPYNDYDREEFDEDHMHPEKYFKNEKYYDDKNNMREWMRMCQTIPNLQMLKQYKNRVTKNDMPLIDWIEENKGYCSKANFIDRTLNEVSKDGKRKNLEFNKFNLFYKHRSKLMVENLFKFLK